MNIYIPTKEQIQSMRWVDPNPNTSDYDAEYHPFGWGKGDTNINWGGDNLRKAWAAGAYDDRDQSTASKKGWLHRDKDEAVRKMHSGLSKWKSDNAEYYSQLQREKALKAWNGKQKDRLQKIKYDGKIYHGWSSLERATGRSRYLLKKDTKCALLS